MNTSSKVSKNNGECNAAVRRASYRDIWIRSGRNAWGKEMKYTVIDRLALKLINARSA